MSIEQRAMRGPIMFYGGKGNLARQIVALLPPHVHYVEPFAGGLAVLFAKRASAIETVNDVHDGLVTLYRVLRDAEQCAHLVAMLEATPYARAEYEACRTSWGHESDPVRKAWAFFVVARQCFGGQHATPGWSYGVGDPGSQPVSKWLSAIEGLPAVHRRLRRVQVEHHDWRVIVARYSGPDVLVYADPPYLAATRSAGRRYEHEMSAQDHQDLIDTLLTYPGLVVLSGYDAPLYAPLEAAGWERRELEVALASSRDNQGKSRTESIWRNPAAVQAWQTAQWPLFAQSAASSTTGAAR